MNEYNYITEDGAIQFNINPCDGVDYIYFYTYKIVIGTSSRKIIEYCKNNIGIIKKYKNYEYIISNIDYKILFSGDHTEFDFKTFTDITIKFWEVSL